MARFAEERLTIETPEHVELYFQRASIGNRFLACAVDHGLQLAMVGVFLLLGSAIRRIGLLLLRWDPQAAQRWLDALGIGLIFLIFFGYFVFFEAFWGGQTPGKRWFHLRVIQRDGRPVTFAGALARNLMRLADLLVPPFYSVGLLTVFLSPSSQRLGDYLANTVVVRERVVEWGEALLGGPSRRAVESLAPRWTLRRPPTPTELLPVTVFLRRREELGSAPRQWLARRITTALEERLLLPETPVQEGGEEAFLEALDASSRTPAQAGGWDGPPQLVSPSSRSAFS
jgi:uncharacterized RDD family membrane protein YckC